VINVVSLESVHWHLVLQVSLEYWTPFLYFDLVHCKPSCMQAQPQDLSPIYLQVRHLYIKQVNQLMCILKIERYACNVQYTFRTHNRARVNSTDVYTRRESQLTPRGARYNKQPRVYHETINKRLVHVVFVFVSSSFADIFCIINLKTITGT